jgi:hypothetical protein
MLRVLDAFELKERGTLLYCKDDDFDNMSKNEVSEYMSKINKIKIYDKNLKEQEYGIKNYDVMLSLSDKIAVALLIDKLIGNANIMIPSEITVLK